jgi:hypothetical protein
MNLKRGGNSNHLKAKASTKLAKKAVLLTTTF